MFAGDKECLVYSQLVVVQKDDPGSLYSKPGTLPPIFFPNLKVKNFCVNLWFLHFFLFFFFFKHCALLHFLALISEGEKIAKIAWYRWISGVSRKCQKSCRMSNTNSLLQTPEARIWIHICIFWVLGQTETFSLSIANKHVSSFFALTSVVKNVIFPEVYLFCL